VLINEVLTTLQANGRPSFSCEFFPPKTPAGEATLWNTLATLQPFKPSFVSVTYGAGGSTQDTSLDITSQIVRDTAIPTLAHLTCVGATGGQLSDAVDRLAQRGVRNILALRGDPVAGVGAAWETADGGFTYAIELVELLAARGDFSIGVAAFPEGHPESASLAQDAQVLADKQTAGAHFAITNLFFSADKYFAMVEQAAARGCDMPILPGLMPVTNFGQIERMPAMSGAQFPPALAQRFEAVRDDEAAVRELGIEVTTELSQELLAGGAPGVHLYTLNHSSATKRIFENLGVASD